ncbi:M48 family metallopeptidase [Kiloniella sp.]|uniref:M48 family metallopeptidase n=1 Tax=Kiloniella sp. TaxID=1938587 RepID=UPI003A920AF7
MPILTVGNTDIAYNIKRSKSAARRRVYLSLDGVDVVVPTTCSDDQISDFVHRKRRWIFDGTEILKEKQAERSNVSRYVSGAKIPFRGRRMRLRVEVYAGSFVDVQYKNGFLVQVPEDLPISSRDALIEDNLRLWLRKRLREDVSAFVKKYKRSHDLIPKGIQIKDQKHLWGSCGQDRVININWHLIFAPKTVLEYAVVHELCHLKERNHDKAFWSLVGSIIPDYEIRKKWLSQNEHLLAMDRVISL